MSTVVPGHQEFPPGLPDDLKMPERSAHRETVDVIASAASYLLDPSIRVFCDMNWYPADGGPATAPDLMTLPIEAASGPVRSYHQGEGPAPQIVLEVPSDSDSFSDIWVKARRAQSHGAPFYVVMVEAPNLEVLRFGPDDETFQPWNGKPIPELANLTIEIVDNRLDIVLPDGTRSNTRSGHYQQAIAQAQQAEEEARQAEAQLEQLMAQTKELERLLEEMGVEPPP